MLLYADVFNASGVVGHPLVLKFVLASASSHAGFMPVQPTSTHQGVKVCRGLIGQVDYISVLKL